MSHPDPYIFTLFTSVIIIRILPSPSMSLWFNWSLEGFWGTTISVELFVGEKCDNGKIGKF